MPQKKRRTRMRRTRMMTRRIMMRKMRRSRNLVPQPQLLQPLPQNQYMNSCIPLRILLTPISKVKRRRRRERRQRRSELRQLTRRTPLDCSTCRIMAALTT
jgi:hypothetical protein